jgi:hypothetical protein
MGNVQFDYLKTRNLAYLWFVPLALSLGCSAEKPVQQVDNGGGATIAFGGAGTTTAPSGSTASTGNAGTVVTSQGALCEAKGEKQSCYCPDGTKSGIQLCDTSGSLQSCEQCSTDTPAKASNAAGNLCADLEGRVGCTAQSYQSEELPASILFVVDRSGSMSCNTPADGQSSEACEKKPETANINKPSKWQITVAALKDVFNKLNQSGARAGLMFFSNDGTCGVNSDLDSGGVSLQLINSSHVSLLTKALEQQNPAGGTPLVGATILAYKHLHQVAGGQCGVPPCGAPGNRFVVLFTDGVDSCPDPSFQGAPCGSKSGSTPCTQYLLNTQVKNALGANIRTYVIGAPGSEGGRGFLSELAYQGGTAKSGCTHGDPNGSTGDCHFDMTTSTNFASDLAGVLRAISGAAIGCEFAVPSVAGVEPSNVNVQYTAPGKDPICIPSDETKDCKGGANGWQFGKNPDGSTNLSKVVLCGNACSTVSNIGNVQVDVIIGCERIVLK